MRISAGLPPGVTALLFEHAEERRGLERELCARLEARGFREVILPILDNFEPYRPLLTARSREELYRFVDRDGQLLALRGDFTPLLARLLAPQLGAGTGQLSHWREEPLALFYRGDVVRFQEAAPGRLREHYQLGAELLGLPAGSVPGDGEEERRERADEQMLRLFLEILESAAGRRRSEGRFHVIVGCAGALDELLAEPPESLTSQELGTAVASRDRAVARRATEVAGHSTLFEVVEKGVPEDLARLGPRAAARVGRLMALVEILQKELGEGSAIDLRVDLAEYATNVLDPDLALRESRWAYYDGVVFRAYPDGSAQPVGQGGRYDRLFATLGAEVPAVGFQLGLDRVLQNGSVESPRSELSEEDT